MRMHWRVDLNFGAVRVIRHAFSEWLQLAVSRANPLLEYEVVFGELVTNAVRYGKRPVDVDVDVDAEHHTQWFVCLLPRDPAGVLASAPPPTRTVMRANIALMGAPYALPTAVSLTAHNLLRIVDTYAPALAAETPDR